MRIVRAACVLPMSGAPIEDGAVVIDDQRIVAAGRWRDLCSYATDEVLDLGDVILLPGLINAHCHLDYTLFKGLIPQGPGFAAWIEKINSLKRSLSESDWTQSVARGLNESRRLGTTTILNIAAYPHLLARLTKPELRVWWFVELIDLREVRDARRIAEGMSDFWVESPDWRGGWGLSPHAPYTASAALFEDCDAVANEELVPVMTHVAESVEERQMFEDGNGTLFEMLSGLGRSMADCGEGAPFFRWVKDDLLKAPWTLAHGNWPEPAAARRMGEIGMSVVHCPRCHAFFGRGRFPYEEWREAGVNVAVGTDSLASNTDLGLLGELRQFRATHPGLSHEDLLGMVTRDAAQCVGKKGELGVLTTGALADMIAIPIGGQTRDVFAHVVEWEGPVDWMMVDGRVVE